MRDHGESVLRKGSTVQNYLVQDTLGRGDDHIEYLAYDSILERSVSLLEYFSRHERARYGVSG